MRIIAEIGVNHDGHLARAKALVDACARAGADFAKFQVFKTTQLTTAKAKRAAYQSDALGEGSQAAMLAQLELSHADLLTLKRHCDGIGIQFLATPFDDESALFLTDELACPTVKIGSGDLDNLPLLMLIASRGVEMIVSTGMSTMDEVELALDTMAFGRQAFLAARDPRQAPFPTRDELAAARRALGMSGLSQFVTVLHCTSEYPAAHTSLNMRAIETLRRHLSPIPIGYSDHSTDDVAAIMAVTLGATVIERHITYDRSARGPDHAASLDEAQFAGMVTAIRRSQSALGSGEKQATEGERAVRAVARKRILAARPLKAGHVLSLGDLVLKRSSEGRAATDLPNVLGKRLIRDADVDEPIEITGS